MNVVKNIPLSGLSSVSDYLNDNALYTHELYTEVGAKCLGLNDANVPLSNRREKPEVGEKDEYVDKPKVCIQTTASLIRY